MFIYHNYLSENCFFFFNPIKLLEKRKSQKKHKQDYKNLKNLGNFMPIEN